MSDLRQGRPEVTLEEALLARASAMAMKREYTLALMEAMRRAVSRGATVSDIALRSHLVGAPISRSQIYNLLRGRTR